MPATKTRKATPKRRAAARKKTAPTSPIRLSQPLGLEGWNNLDPIILAALAAEEPLLLIGRHGTAKSFLLERLAGALELEFRFYNASLINYDDLVGFPVPEDDNSRLKFIGTPSSIWDAEVVFLDEINRTKPELQNKLFPIIHERRVQGIPLEKLKYRWAAMNPPPSPEEDEENPDAYLGAEPLDPALADRFSFLVPVPAWSDLCDTARRRILQDQYAGEHPFQVPPTELVKKARRIYLALRTGPPKALAHYVVSIERAFDHKKQYLSARRLTTLHRNILAVHAARIAIRGDVKVWKEAKGNLGDWEESALLALLYSRPQTAIEGNLQKTEVLAMHRHTWEICRLKSDDPWKIILDTPDPLDRLVVARGLSDKLEDLDLGKVILGAVSAQEDTPRQRAVALVSYLAFSRERDIPATVVETLARETKTILEPVKQTEQVHSAKAKNYMEVANLVSSLEGKVNRGESNRLIVAYSRNLLYSLLPNDLVATKPHELHKFLENIWSRLDLDNETLEEPCAPPGTGKGGSE